jgi:hypothetical protein
MGVPRAERQSAGARRLDPREERARIALECAHLPERRAPPRRAARGSMPASAPASASDSISFRLGAARAAKSASDAQGAASRARTMREPVSADRPRT